MTISYTSNYDELKNYREALLDRLAELIIANHTRITNKVSIQDSQKTTKDGFIQTGRTDSEDEKLVLYQRDIEANNLDATYLDQILNIFSQHGDTDEPNYGIPVEQINLVFLMNDEGQEVPYITGPGVPSIPLSSLDNFFNNNVSQFVDITVEKTKYHKEKVREFLETNLREILPDNISIIRRINNWFQEFDDLKTHIEPGQEPKFQTERELFESDDEKLTYFVRQATDLLYPQAHPIYSAENYYDTEKVLIDLDFKFKEERARLDNIISILTIRGVSKDKIIKLITDRIIPALTNKYTAQLQAEGAESQGFSVHQLPLIENALLMNDYTMIEADPVYNQNFQEVEEKDRRNNYGIPQQYGGFGDNYATSGITNSDAQEDGLVSNEFTYYHGIAVACKPGDYISNSRWGIRNQYSGLLDSDIQFGLVQYTATKSHRHSWGNRHTWYENAYYSGRGTIQSTPYEFTVTHPNGSEFAAKVANWRTEYPTSLETVSTFSNISPSGLIIDDVKEPPRGFSGTTTNAQEVQNGVTYTFDYTWGAHTIRSSGISYSENDEPYRAAYNKLPTFFAYVGGDVDRFTNSPAPIRDTGMAIIFWDGEKWYYDSGGNSWSSSRTFKPIYEDFIIYQVNTRHNSVDFSIDVLGNDFGTGDLAIQNSHKSYYFSNARTSTNQDAWMGQGAAGGNWSGYYRRKFSAKNGIEHWREHGDARGAQGMLDTEIVDAPDPDGSGTTKALKITLNDRIKYNTDATRYQYLDNDGDYQGWYLGASDYYHFVGLEAESAIPMTEGEQYTLLMNLQCSKVGMKWRVKIGDYRTGHTPVPWQSIKTGIWDGESEWITVKITGITPIARNSDAIPSNNILSNYNYPVSDAIGQLCIGFKPQIYNTDGTLTGNSTSGKALRIDELIDEYILVDNIEIYKG